MEPSKSTSRTEKSATAEEIIQASEKLTQAERAKLYSFARNRARMMALYGSDVTEEDLVQEAIVALLEQRRHWNPKKVDFVGVVMGAIRSIASNYKAAAKGGGFALPDSQLRSPDSDEDEEAVSLIGNYPDHSAGPEQVAIVSNMLSEVYELFVDDPEALVIMDGWRDNMSGTEIIEALEIDRTAYETIARRIRRTVAAHWPKGN